MVEQNNYIIKCKEHEEYTASRPPTEDCSGCWALYNWKWNLDATNRDAKSNQKKRIKPHRRIPTFKSLPKRKDGSFENFAEFEDYADKVLSRPSNDYKLVSLGIDPSLAGTGVAFICYSDNDEKRKWYVGSLRVGFQLNQDDPLEKRLLRKNEITRVIVNIYDNLNLLYERDGNLPILMEDHAHGQGGNRSTELRELSGVLKNQFYINFGVTPKTPSITSARSDVLTKGSKIKGNNKKKIKECLDECHWQNFHKHLTHDEIDAWVVATEEFVQDKDFFLDPEIDFSRNNQKRLIQVERR